MTQIDPPGRHARRRGVVGVRIGTPLRPHTLRGGMGGARRYGGREIQGLMVTFNAIGTAIREDHATIRKRPRPCRPRPEKDRVTRH